MHPDLLFFCLLALLVAPPVILAAPGNRAGACGFAWNNNIYILGGEPNSTTFSYTSAPLQTTLVQWKDLPSPNQSFSFNNTCVVIPSGILVVLAAPLPLGNAGNTLAIFDLNLGQWNDSIITSGSVNNAAQFFSQIQGHVVTLIQDRYIFLYGGYFGTDTQPNNQAYLLDSTNWTWQNLTMTGGPSTAILDAGCGALKDKVFIFGGQNPSRSLPYSSIWSFNITSQSWHLESSVLVYPYTDVGVANWRDERLWIMPGLSSGTVADSRLSYFDLAASNLTMPSISDSATPASRYQQAVFSLGDTMLIYGGIDGLEQLLPDPFHAFDMTNQIWTVVVPFSNSNVAQPSLVTGAPTGSTSLSGTLVLPTNSTDASSKNSSSVSPAIIGGVIAAAVIVAVAVAFVFWRRHAATRKKLLHFLPPKGDGEFPRIRRVV